MNIPHPLLHAYLLTGGDRAGRLGAARKLAAAYLCPAAGGPCGMCRHCVKVERGIHPDVIFLSPAPGRADITMEQVRAMRSDVYIRPNEGSRKVYVIDGTDGLRPECQNVLLKVLEDGPAYGAFVLCLPRPGMLLDTVCSRCGHLSLPPAGESLPPEAVERGRRLARLLTGGDEWELARGVVELEQTTKGGQPLEQLLAATEEELSALLREQPRTAARALRAVRECRGGLVYHPGPGHVLGWLCMEMTRLL